MYLLGVPVVGSVGGEYCTLSMGVGGANTYFVHVYNIQCSLLRE